MRYGKTLVYRAAESFVNHIVSNWSADSPSSPGDFPAVRSGSLDAAVSNSLDNARDSGGKFALSRNVYKIFLQIDPSKPGGFRRRGVRSLGKRGSGKGRRRRYAGFLEFGTGKMAERPFVRPGLKHVEQEFPKLAGRTSLAVQGRGAWRP